MLRHKNLVQHHQIVPPAHEGSPGLFIARPGAGGVPFPVRAKELPAAAVLLHRHGVAQKPA